MTDFIGQYILHAEQPVPVEDLLAWARWMETANRQVARTDVTAQVEVSTVFLGLDHNLSGVGPPLLWETMIFGGPRHGMLWRYSSRAAAEAGHLDAVEVAKRA